MPQPTVADVMTADVVSVPPQTTYKQVVDVLVAHDIAAVPVVEPSGRPLGVVSEADLVAKPEAQATTSRRWWALLPGRRSRLRKARGATARELMTAPALTVPATATVNAAIRVMAHNAVRRLFVVDDDGALVGVIAHRDVLSTFLRPDEEIRAEIVERVFGRAMFFPRGTVRAVVDDGVVTITGTVERRGEVEITEEIVKAVRGVVAVHNELGYRFDEASTAAN